MLALRARGLGSVWTTVAPRSRKRAWPSCSASRTTEVTQAGLFPVAYTVGTDFKPGPRALSTTVVHFDRW